MKTSRTERLLNTLDSEARGIISELLEIGYAHNLNPQVHSAYRSPAEQDGLYAMGRTKPGKIVTNAKGTPIPQSKHCYRVAVDVHFDNNQDGTAEWDMELYEQLWKLGCEKGLDEKGLRWAGNWTSFKEGPHFEVTWGRSWRDFAVDAGYMEKHNGYTAKPEPKKPKKNPPKKRKATAKTKETYNDQCLISDFQDTEK